MSKAGADVLELDAIVDDVCIEDKVHGKADRRH